MRRIEDLINVIKEVKRPLIEDSIEQIETLIDEL
jgi:hypothetical protein